MRAALTFFALLFTLPAGAAQRVLVLPFESTSVDPELTRTATDLMVIFLKDRGLETTAVAERPADPDAAAQAAQASHIVQGRITRVGMKALVFAEMRKVGSAQASWTGRLTAARPEDLESVMARMARGIDTGESVQEAVDIHTVTENEANALKRKKANHYFGLNLGGFAALNADEVFTGLGVFWLYDVRTLMFEVDLRTAFGDSGGRMGVGISGYYPFSEDDFTPYVGGGLEYGFMTLEGEDDVYGDYNEQSESGLSAGAGVGVLFGRTSTVALRADVRYLVSFYEVGDARPHGAAFSLGLGF